jgi:hypothetical protein
MPDPPRNPQGNGEANTDRGLIADGELTCDYHSLPTRRSPPDLGYFAVDPDFERRISSALRSSKLRESWREQKYGEEAKDSKRGHTPSPVRRLYAEQQEEMARWDDIPTPPEEPSPPVIAIARNGLCSISPELRAKLDDPAHESFDVADVTAPFTPERGDALYRMPHLVSDAGSNIEPSQEERESWKSRAEWDLWFQGRINKMLALNPSCSLKRKREEHDSEDRIAAKRICNQRSVGPLREQTLEANGGKVEIAGHRLDTQSPPLTVSEQKNLHKSSQSTPPLIESSSSESPPSTEVLNEKHDLSLAIVKEPSLHANGKAGRTLLDTGDRHRLSLGAIRTQMKTQALDTTSEEASKLRHVKRRRSF